MKNKFKNIIDFEQILLLIQDERNRVYAKVNSGLVLLYYKLEKLFLTKWKRVIGVKKP